MRANIKRSNLYLDFRCVYLFSFTINKKKKVYFCRLEKAPGWRNGRRATFRL